MLESVEFLSQLKSSRAFSDKDLIKNDSEFSTIYAQIDNEEKLKINLLRKGGKKIYINDCLQKKQSEIKNFIRSVCFSSEDINVVRGEPSYRRMWLDKVVFQLEPVYFELLSRYNRLIKQRRHFWHSNIFKNHGSEALLDSYDSQIANIGTRIYRRRRRALERLTPYVEYWHNHLSGNKEIINLNYLSKIEIANYDDEKKITSEYIAKLLEQRNLEKITGKCNFGPHRDDIEFFINNLSLRKFGSSGQQRTMILALKLAELDLLRNTLFLNPIFILDDVLAELDLDRQKILLDSVGQKSQCFISATHLDAFNKGFLENSQLIFL